MITRYMKKLFCTHQQQQQRTVNHSHNGREIISRKVSVMQKYINVKIGNAERTICDTNTCILKTISNSFISDGK